MKKIHSMNSLMLHWSTECRHTAEMSGGNGELASLSGVLKPPMLLSLVQKIMT